MKWNFAFKKKTTDPKPKKSKTREWVDALVFALVASTIIKGLLFSAYAIPSGSMEGTELTGDYLFVSKCSYGPRMPITPLAIPFLEPVVGNFRTYWDAIKLPYFRLPGFSDVKKGDIVVFNKPEEIERPVDERTTLIKRCQGTPGDLLTIVNAQVFINGIAAKNPPDAQTSYTVVTDGKDLNPLLLTSLNITLAAQNNSDTYQMIIPRKNIAALKGYSNIKSITPSLRKAGDMDPQVFPQNEHFKWNIDNFGPLMLPKKGWTVKLNDSTLTLYRRAIELYEHNKIDTAGTKIIINGKPVESYTFKMNYYWMMGDNRHDSLDSRFWGYVPEDHIIGKALITFMSIDSTKDFFHQIRWDRVFKPIN